MTVRLNFRLSRFFLKITERSTIYHNQQYMSRSLHKSSNFTGRHNWYYIGSKRYKYLTILKKPVQGEFNWTLSTCNVKSPQLIMRSMNMIKGSCCEEISSRLMAAVPRKASDEPVCRNLRIHCSRLCATIDSWKCPSRQNVGV